MENKNVLNNLIIKQVIESDYMGHNPSYIASSADYDFKILDKAYANTGKLYAKLKLAVENNKCISDNCEYELTRIKHLDEAPQLSLSFLQTILSELEVIDDSNYDPNNNYRYTIAYSILKGRPGFSKTDGYDVNLNLLEDGTQNIVFTGPGFEGDDLVINDAALSSLRNSGTSIVATTPDINKDMLRLLTEVNIFSSSDIGEDGKLLPNAKIREEFVLYGNNGVPLYEIIDLGDNKGRNILQYDLDKIERVATPYINAEVAGLLSSEQEAVAAWNVYLSKDTSVEEDDQMVQNANAASSSWSYETDLPLSQDKKVLFEKKYKEYFMNNYLKQFTTNQLPTVTADAAVFDLAEAKKAKAQKFIEDNNL